MASSTRPKPLDAGWTECLYALAMKFANILSAAILGAALCSTSPAAARRLVPPSNPCRLATQSEISAVMGKASARGQHHESMGGDICTFNGPTYDYEIYIQTADPALVDSYTHLPGAALVTGIGDLAVWSQPALFVRKGGRAVEINFQLPSKPKRMTPTMQKLARTIASRM